MLPGHTFMASLSHQITERVQFKSVRRVAQGSCIQMGSWGDAKTAGERLRWVREEVLGLPSTHATERFFEEMPAEARPQDYGFMSVGRYEKNERVPRMDYPAALSRAAGVSVAWLVMGDGSPWDAPQSEASRRLELIRRIANPGLAQDSADERIQELLETIPLAPSPAQRDRGVV
jgi:hypothetical protein